MDNITVSLPPITELNLWILPLLHAVLFAVSFAAFVKTARSAENDTLNDGDTLAIVGCAIIALGTGVMMLVMSWHLFAKSLALPGY